MDEIATADLSLHAEFAIRFSQLDSSSGTQLFKRSTPASCPDEAQRATPPGVTRLTTLRGCCAREDAARKRSARAGGNRFPDCFGGRVVPRHFIHHGGSAAGPQGEARGAGLDTQTHKRARR